jgi:hypothetical protein
MKKRILDHRTREVRLEEGDVLFLLDRDWYEQTDCSDFYTNSSADAAMLPGCSYIAFLG